MYEQPYDLVHGPGGYRVRIRARDKAVLASAMLNRGTAFTEPERRALGLTGRGQPVPARRLRRAPVPDRPGQQRAAPPPDFDVI